MWLLPLDILHLMATGKKIIILSAAAIVLITISWIPVQQTRLISEGVDKFEAHRQLYGDRLLHQEIKGQGTIIGAAFILVQLKPNGQPADVVVRAKRAPDGQELAQAVIPAIAIQDDTFATAIFNHPVETSETVILELSAPAAAREDSIGVRTDPTARSDTPVFANGQEKGGILAHQLVEKVPLWGKVKNDITAHPKHWRSLSLALLITLLLALAASKPGWGGKSQSWQRTAEIGIIIAIALFAFVTRAQIISRLGGVSGGDPYNYLLITKSIAAAEDPWQAKRMPGYPLLLLPIYLADSIDDIAAMRIISAASGVGTIFLVVVLARTLHLPWSVQLMAAALLAWQKDFFVTSLRPEPYTLYALLLLASLILFFRAAKPWQHILFGIVLGYSAMIRHEGFAVALILFAASLLKYFWPLMRRRISPAAFNWKAAAKSLLLMYGPAFIIVLPFFINNTVKFGNPLYTRYFAGERLQIVDSWHAGQAAMAASWGVIGSMFKPVWDELERIPVSEPLFIIIFLLVAALALARFTRKRSGKKITISFIILCAVLAALTVLAMFTAPHRVLKTTMTISAAVLLASSIPFVSLLQWRGVLVAAVLLSQLLIATWFHPFPKHYQQSYPLLIMLAATALLTVPALSPDGHTMKWSRVLTVAVVITILLPITYAQLRLYEHVTLVIDKNNAVGALDSVTYRAVRAARHLKAPYGVNAESLPARLYLGAESVAYPHRETSDPASEAAWLASSNIQTLILTNGNKSFQIKDPAWEQAAYFKSEGKDERLYESWVYKISKPGNH